MRTILATLAIWLAASVVDAASAEIIYPWCADYSRGSTNCGFSTLQQCQWAISGAGGFCNSNPRYNPPIYRRR